MFVYDIKLLPDIGFITLYGASSAKMMQPNESALNEFRNNKNKRAMAGNISSQLAEAIIIRQQLI